jgi:hypothetical protein
VTARYACLVRLPLAIAAVTTIVLGGCFLPIGGRPVVEPTGPVAAAAWEIPAASIGTQRLYRVQYQNAQDKLGFRLSLYLSSPRTYRMEASDGIGRRIFSLELRDADALWLDHRERTFCRVGEIDTALRIPLADLPLLSLPKLLLGVMPMPPATDTAQDAKAISYLDARGQKWSGGFGLDGNLEWWSLVQGGEPVAWWQRKDKESIFSDRRGGVQLRWIEMVVERLEGAREPLKAPPGFEEADCTKAPSSGGTL